MHLADGFHWRLRLPRLHESDIPHPARFRRRG